MARNFGKIISGFWDNARVRRLPEDARWMLAYLFTCPNSTAAGTYTLPLAVMTDHLQWKEDRVLKALHEVSKKPYALWDRETRVVYIPSWWQHNTVENPNVATHVASSLITLPDCEYKAFAIRDYKSIGRFPDAVNRIIGDWKYTADPKSPDLFGEQQPEPPRDSTPRPPSAKPEKRAERLSDDWVAPAEYRIWARGKGIGDEQIDTELRKFHRYYSTGDGKARKNYYAAWQNWLENVTPAKSNGHAHTNGKSQHSSTFIDGIEVSGDLALYKSGPGDSKWIPRARGWRERKFWQPQWGPEPGQLGCKMPAELLAPEL